ncbi:TIGR02444 family protein [Ectopseudomonas mendocina]|uniref:TIGR02444 family protein n=1 Tax=Ectopseudomonas mendocina TaxID=300 RepID=A0ABZ2RG28_ECTME
MPTDLWPFAVTLYQQPGVEQACLQLQAQGADVCVVICAVWLEKHQASCRPERVLELQNHTRHWHEQVVQALRQLRQSWRQPAQEDTHLLQLREHVKRLELEAEREQLRRLTELTHHWLNEPDTTPQDWLGQLGPEPLNPAAVQLLRCTAAELMI